MSGTGANYVSPQVFGPTQLSRPGNRVVVLGASIENLSSFRTATSENFGKDWPTYAMLLGDGRFNLIQNMAIGGQTTDQFIARFNTDVTPYRPNIVPMGSIENDVQLLLPLSHHKANIRTLTSMCRNIGALPVWRTAMPHSATGVHTAHALYNAWLTDYCSQEGLPVIDFWRVLVDPNTGLYKAWLTADGVHPNEEGAYQLAVYWLQQMEHYLPPDYFQNPQSANDTGQLLPTPLFTTNSSGVPTGWVAAGGTPAGTARTMITDSEGYGQWLRHTHTASTASLSTQSGSGAIVPPTIANVGDVLEITGKVSSDGGPVINIVCSIITDGTTPSLNRLPMSNITHSLDHATYKQIMPPLPAGFLRYQVTLSSGSTSATTGTVDFSYPIVRNLTATEAYPI